MRIAIVDGQAGFRKTIRTILEKEPGLTIVAEAKNGLDAIGVVIEHKPDVVLVGTSIPPQEGLDATKVIRSRYPKPELFSCPFTQKHQRQQCRAKLVLATISARIAALMRSLLPSRMVTRRGSCTRC